MNKFLIKLNKISLFAQKIANHIPSNHDSKYQKLFKTIGLINVLYENSYNETNLFGGLASTIYSHGAIFKTLMYNSLMSNFFATSIAREYIDSLRNNNLIIRFTNSDIGDIFFHKAVHSSKYSSLSYEAGFSNNFNFDKFIDLFWNCYNNQVIFDVIINNKHQSSNEYADSDTLGQNVEFSTINLTDPIFGTFALNQFDQFIKQYLHYQQYNISRVYLLYGNPGTGKSTFISNIAKRLNKRYLCDAACSWRSEHIMKSVAFPLVESLKPDFMIFDDIDKNTESNSIQNLLISHIPKLKEKFPKTSFVFTANNPEILDAALLRPGRIDQIIHFPDPSLEERKLLLEGYKDQFKIDANFDINKLAKISDGLTQAYLREIVLQMRYQSMEELQNTILNMIEIPKIFQANKSNKNKYALDVTE